MLDVRERYRRDPLFNKLVQLLMHPIAEAQMTPTEVREAAMLACVLHEERNPRPMMLTPDQFDQVQAIKRGDKGQSDGE